MYRSRSPWLLRRRIWSASRPRGSPKTRAKVANCYSKSWTVSRHRSKSTTGATWRRSPKWSRRARLWYNATGTFQRPVLTPSDHAGRTLDCWKEVEQFKNAFAAAEKVRCRVASANLFRNSWLLGSNIVYVASIVALILPATPLPAVDGLFSPGPCGPYG